MKTWEMIKMLMENPKLKATDGNRVVYIGNNHHKEDLFIAENSGKPEKYGDVFYPAIMNCIDVDWQIVRQHVPAWEAVKAWTKGKKVTCECSDCEEVNNSCEYLPNHPNCISFCGDGVKNGIWYIND